MAAVYDVVAPSRCAGCDAVNGQTVCDTCQHALRRAPLPPPLSDGEYPVNAAFVFSDPVRPILHAGKYRGAVSALTALGEVVAQRLLDIGGHVPATLVPVPLGARRMRDRGYNQSAVLAAAIADVVGAQVHDALARVRETPPQVGNDDAWRARNVAGAFLCHAQRLQEPVWLVDDVCTTGATTREAARAIAASGAREVEVVVAARVL